MYQEGKDRLKRLNDKAAQHHLHECSFEPELNKSSDRLNKSFDHFMSRNSEYVKKKTGKLEKLKKESFKDRKDGEELFKPRTFTQEYKWKRERDSETAIENRLNQAGSEYKKKREERIRKMIDIEMSFGKPGLTPGTSDILAKAFVENLTYMYEKLNSRNLE